MLTSNEKYISLRSDDYRFPPKLIAKIYETCDKPAKIDKCIYHPEGGKMVSLQNEYDQHFPKKCSTCR